MSAEHLKCHASAYTIVQAMLCNIQVTLPVAVLKTAIDSLIHAVMEHVYIHHIQALASVKRWKAKASSFFTARLDQLLQHHRPRMGLLEDWCSKRKLALKGLENLTSRFLCQQYHQIDMQACPQQAA